jgi:hypothetical protein
MIRMRPRVEVMAATHHHHNADRKEDVWACPVDRACAEHVLVACSTAYWSCMLVVTGWANMGFVDLDSIDRPLISMHSAHSRFRGNLDFVQSPFAHQVTAKAHDSM